MEPKKNRKQKAKTVGKVAETKVLSTGTPEKKSRKKGKKEPEPKIEMKKSRTKKVATESTSSKGVVEKKQIEKKSGKESAQKKRVKREKASEPVKKNIPVPVTAPDQIGVEPEKSKSKSKNILEKKARKTSSSKEKKSSKKPKNTLDNVGKSDIIGTEEKGDKVRGRRSKVVKQIDEDDDFKEGQKPKRKKRERIKKASDFKSEYQFNDSIDNPDGDARADFNKRIDGEPDYIWCLKRECRIYRNICGMYVKPSCINKKRCQYYEHGMMVKSKYNLKTLEDPQKDSKKKKGGDGEEIVDTDGDSMNDTD